MNISEVLKSDRKYAAKEDVSTTGVDAVIGMVTIEQIGDDLKPTCTFMGGTLKPLVLNKSNCAILASLFGDETNNWSGKSINVYTDPSVQFQGQVVGGLKVRPSASQLHAAGVQIAQNALQGALDVPPSPPVESYEQQQVNTAQSMQNMPNDDVPF